VEYFIITFTPWKSGASRYRAVVAIFGIIFGTLNIELVWGGHIRKALKATQATLLIISKGNWYSYSGGNCCPSDII
jgi:hypothetical protein